MVEGWLFPFYMPKFGNFIKTSMVEGTWKNRYMPNKILIGNMQVFLFTLQNISLFLNFFRKTICNFRQITVEILIQLPYTVMLLLLKTS